MRIVALIVKSVLFYFLGISLWFAGTVFHGLLWWILGIPEMPAFLPFMNLLFLPCAFWLSYQLTLNPKGLNCVRCNDAEAQKRKQAHTLTRKRHVKTLSAES